MITRLEARTNCAAYTKGCKSLYIRINYWWVEPEPFWFLKVGQTEYNPLDRCDKESGNCVALGSMNPRVTEKQILDYARKICKQTDFGLGGQIAWPNTARAQWRFQGPAGSTESFGNWRKNADAWETALHLIERFEFTIIEPSTVRVYQEPGRTI